MITSADENELSKAVHRLTGRQRAGERVIKSLREGVSTTTALRKAGVRKEILRLLEAAPPTNLAAALTGLARCFEHDDHRRRTLRSMAVYPTVLAGVALALSLTIQRVAIPSIAWMGDNAFHRIAPLSPMPLLIVSAVPALMLVLLAIGLVLDKPIYPFKTQRERHDRALLLGVASTLTSAGARVEATLRAAAPLASASLVGRSAKALAESLDRGGDPSDDLLMGAVQTALFKAAAARGAGAISLHALAEWHEREAVQSLPRFAARTELVTVAIGGVAIASAAIAFVAPYARLVAGG